MIVPVTPAKPGKGRVIIIDIDSRLVDHLAMSSIVTHDYSCYTSQARQGLRYHHRCGNGGTGGCQAAGVFRHGCGAAGSSCMYADMSSVCCQAAGVGSVCPVDGHL